MKAFVCKQCDARYFSAADENLKCDSCGGTLIEIMNVEGNNDSVRNQSNR